MQSKTSRICADRLARLRQKFDDDIRHKLIPGAVILVAQSGQITFFESLGFRDRGKNLEMTRDAIFCLASLTKLFTSVAIMQLAEEGKLYLSQPVSRYLPKFKGLKVSVERQSTVNGEIAQALMPPANEMTLQDLLRHTSGLTYADAGNSLVHQAYATAKVFDWDQTNAEMVEKLAALPLAYHPGSTFEYSISTDVLGHIVEIVSGMRLDLYIQEKISKPLGLTNTVFHVEDSDLHRLALSSPSPEGFLVPAVNLARPQHAKWISGGGGLFSTAMDVYRLMQMLLNKGELDGVRLLSPKTVELMTCNHLPPNVLFGPYTNTLQAAAPTPEMGQGFGLGFAVRTTQGRNPLPGSIGDFYWTGVSGTYAWVDPTEDLVGILMLRAPHERIYYRSIIRQLVYQALVT